MAKRSTVTLSGCCDGPGWRQQWLIATRQPLHIHDTTHVSAVTASCTTRPSKALPECDRAGEWSPPATASHWMLATFPCSLHEQHSVSHQGLEHQTRLQSQSCWGQAQLPLGKFSCPVPQFSFEDKGSLWSHWENRDGSKRPGLSSMITVQLHGTSKLAPIIPVNYYPLCFRLCTDKVKTSC